MARLGSAPATAGEAHPPGFLDATQDDQPRPDLDGAIDAVVPSLTAVSDEAAAASLRRTRIALAEAVDRRRSRSPASRGGGRSPSRPGDRGARGGRDLAVGGQRTMRRSPMRHVAAGGRRPRNAPRVPIGAGDDAAPRRAAWSCRRGSFGRERARPPTRCRVPARRPLSVATPGADPLDRARRAPSRQIPEDAWSASARPGRTPVAVARRRPSIADHRRCVGHVAISDAGPPTRRPRRTMMSVLSARLRAVRRRRCWRSPFRRTLAAAATAAPPSRSRRRRRPCRRRCRRTRTSASTSPIAAQGRDKPVVKIAVDGRRRRPRDQGPRRHRDSGAPPLMSIDPTAPGDGERTYRDVGINVDATPQILDAAHLVAAHEPELLHRLQVRTGGHGIAAELRQRIARNQRPSCSRAASRSS